MRVCNMGYNGLLRVFTLLSVFVGYRAQIIIGGWTLWEAWSPCRGACGSSVGVSTRTRICVFVPCTGPSEETRSCSTVLCSGWGTWEPWTSCSVTCGGTGISFRTRICFRVGSACGGSSFESIPCQASPCTAGWSDWSPWSSCSGPCSSTAVRNRYRYCNGAFCPGSSTESDSVHCGPTPPCSWYTWGEWSACVGPCGFGSRVRARTCPRVGFCAGQITERLPCQSISCGWGAWGPWFGTLCPGPCGGYPGQNVRIRNCNTDSCPGSPVDTKPCVTPPCAENWGVWGPWTPICPGPCGGFPSEIVRIRTCGGTSCPGPPSDTRPCVTPPCAGWDSWGPWSRCTAACEGGSGLRERRRICRNEPCIGLRSESLTCASVIPCSWGTWGPCFGRCGSSNGQSVRTRICVPERPCRSESRICFIPPCTSWNPWEPWGHCLAECGAQGFRRRRRSCSSCPQSNTQIRQCVAPSCNL